MKAHKYLIWFGIGEGADRRWWNDPQPIVVTSLEAVKRVLSCFEKCGYKSSRLVTIQNLLDLHLGEKIEKMMGRSVLEWGGRETYHEEGYVVKKVKTPPKPVITVIAFESRIGG